MLTRTDIERLPHRAAFAFEITRAEAEGDGQYRIEGWMNSLGVMTSRRILHPDAYRAWLKRNAGATLPMLANHGRAASFATIGVWDTFGEVDEKRGVLWGGYVGRGTSLCDEARTLLDQKLLRQLSIGWVTNQARWIKDDDKDLDPWFAKKMREAGVDECLAFLDWAPMEGSVVDVADDLGGRLAAGYGEQLTEQLAELSERVASLCKDSAPDDVVTRAVEAARAATAQIIEDFATGLDNRLVETIEARLADLGAAYLDDPDDDADSAAGDDETDRADGVPAGDTSALFAGTDLASLTERISAAAR